MSHGTYEWCKIRRKTDLLFQKFWPEGSKFSKFPLWLVPLCKVNNVSHQNSTDELCAMTMKNDPTFEEESLQNWHEKFDKFLPEHLKVSKICALMGSFWTKYIMFELKKYRGVIYHGNKEWCKIWRRLDLSFQNWHRSLTNIDPSTWMCQISALNAVLLTKVYNVWVKKVQKSYIWWQWRLMQNMMEN